MSVDDLLDVDIAAAADVKWNPVHSSRHRCGCGQATTKRLGRQGVETAAACHCERAGAGHVSVLGWPFHCAPATKEP